MLERVTLRAATEHDLEFLFEVSTEAMRPVVERLHAQEVSNRDEEFRKYKERFEPNRIQIIRYKDHDVGRLRIVRSPQSIYVGGIQILPAFQGKGIGTAIFTDLMKESKQSGIPIVLEVHEVNTDAIAFYRKMGFAEADKQGNKIVLKTVIE